VGGPPELGLAEGRTTPRRKKTMAYEMLHAGEVFLVRRKQWRAVMGCGTRNARRECHGH